MKVVKNPYTGNRSILTRVKCNCSCHTDRATMHFVPCCDPDRHNDVYTDIAPPIRFVESEGETMIIAFASGKELFDFQGRSFGAGEDRALYYLKSLGRHRIYRRAYPNPSSQDEFEFVLMTYNNTEMAEKACREVNEIYGDSFAPVETPIEL